MGDPIYFSSLTAIDTLQCGALFDAYTYRTKIHKQDEDANHECRYIA